MADTARRLIHLGLILFLLGLLTGLIEQQVSNPRMGLAAHLEGVMNGTFPLALGASIYRPVSSNWRSGPPSTAPMRTGPPRWRQSSELAQ